MVVQQETTPAQDAPAGAEAQATQGQAEAVSADTGSRVQTTMQATVIDGIAFAPLTSDPSVYVSEPIDDTAKIERLVSIPGFVRAVNLSREDTAAVDAANTAAKRLAADREQGATSGTDIAALRTTNAELVSANFAMAAELAATRTERDDAVRKLAGSEVPRLQQQIEMLQQQIDQGGGASIALQQENQQLREANAQLAKALRDAPAQPAPAEGEQPPAPMQ